VRENTLQKIAGCQYYLGNYEESLRALKHLHHQKPESFELTYRIAQINLEKLDKPEEALQYFDLCKDLFKKNLIHVYGEAFELVMDPKDAPDIYYELFVGRGRSNLQLQNFQEAIHDGNWAVFLRRNNHEGYHIRAMAKASSGQLSELCDDIRQAKKLGSQEVGDLRKKYCR
jgi:tetratricopeptide (TPR) repeat protein